MPQGLRTDAQDFPHDFHLPRGLCPRLPWAPPTAAGSPDPGWPAGSSGRSWPRTLITKGGRKGRQLPLPAKPWMKKSSGLPVTTVRTRAAYAIPQGAGRGCLYPELLARKGAHRPELQQRDASGP